MPKPMDKRYTGLFITHFFGCTEGQFLSADSPADRKRIKAKFKAMLAGGDPESVHDFGLTSHRNNEGGGFTYQLVGEHYDLTLKTWAELGTAHIFVDVTQDDQVKAVGVYSGVIAILRDLLKPKTIPSYFFYPLALRDPVPTVTM